MTAIDGSSTRPARSPGNIRPSIAALISLLVAASVQAAPVESAAISLERGVKWYAVNGGPRIDWVNRVIQTNDGAIVSVGFKGREFDGKIVERWTAVAQKYTTEGKLLWSRDFPNAGMNAFWSVREDADGRLIIAGFAAATPGAEYDARLSVLDRNGRQVFAKSYGGAKDDRATDVLITADGSFLLVGQTESIGAGERDVLLVKTDKNGVEQWRKAYGGPGMDRGFAAVEDDSGSYVITGTTGSEAKIEGLIFKVDSNGKQLWWTTIPGDKNVIPHFVNRMADGRLVITGYTNSWGAAATDFMVISLTGAGKVQRIETLGGAGEDHGITAADDRHGGLWLVGYSKSFGDGRWNATLARVKPDGHFEDGVIVLDKADETYGDSVVSLADGDVIVGGRLDKTGGNSQEDLMLVRLDPTKVAHLTQGVVIKQVQ